MNGDSEVRIMACGDLHIGRFLHGRSLLEDQEWILQEIVRHCHTQRVHCLCVTGDLFDRSVPSSEAIQLADRFFESLVTGCAIPLLIIAGNHDSPERLDFTAGFLKRQGLHIHGSWKPRMEHLDFVSDDQSSRVRIHPVPYMEPALARSLLNDPTIHDHQSAWNSFLARNPLAPGPDASTLNLLVCHAYLSGGQESESERPLSLGMASLVSADTFRAFDLVLAGHLHRPQHISPGIWYTGSPLVYSASECGQDKSLSLLRFQAGAQPLADSLFPQDPAGKSPFRVEQLALKPRRRTLRLRGELQTLLQSEPNPKDLVFVDLEDQLPVFDAFARLQKLFPGLLHVRRLEQTGGQVQTRHQRRARVEAGLGELIQGYLEESAMADRLPLWQDLIDQTLARSLRDEASAEGLPAQGTATSLGEFQ